MKRFLTLTFAVFLLSLNSLAQESVPVKKPLDIEKDLIGLENQPAPLFTKTAMNGNDYDLEKLNGKIVLINLWGTFCPPCITEMPKLNEMVKKYEKNGIVFLAPAPDEKSVLEKFLRQTEFDYQVLPDSFDVIRQYAPKKKDASAGKGFMMLLPTHLVIDQNGAVTKHLWGYGENTPKILADEIERLLKNPVKYQTAVSVTTQNITPEQRVKDYFKAFNSGDEKTMSDFLSENIAAGSLAERPVQPRLEFYKKMLGDMKAIEIRQITSENPTEIIAVAQTKRGEQVNFTFSFEPAPPQKIVGMRVDIGESPKESVAQTPLTRTEFLTGVENYLDKTVKADEFSGAVLIAKNDKPVYEKAFGLADKDRNIPNRTNTKFNLGSINKIFTQAAVQQLIEQGKISLDDKLGKYLPDYPNAEAREKVTVRHLLTMTSGIGDIFGENYLKTPKKNLRNIKDFIPLFSGEPLAFEPGTKNQYSNGGYILLGAIIEKVSDKNYYDYMSEHIFKPLGMNDTKFYESDKPTPNVAEGYTKNSENQIDKNRRQNNFDTRPARGSSAGGGYSTLADLLKFSLALQSGKIHLPNQRQFTGIGVAGGAPGINAMLEVIPETGYTIVVLSNYDPPSAGTVARELRNMIQRIKE